MASQYKVVVLEKLPGVKVPGMVGGPFILGVGEKPLEVFLNEQGAQGWHLAGVLPPDSSVSQGRAQLILERSTN